MTTAGGGAREAQHGVEVAVLHKNMKDLAGLIDE